MKVFINSKERHINTDKISFATVVLYGLYGIPHYERIAPTVTYRYANQTENTSMPQRSSIRLQDGMNFSVINGKKVATVPHTPANSSTIVPRVTIKPEALVRQKQELCGKGLGWPPHFTEEQKKAEIQRFADLIAPHEARYQAQQALKKPTAEPDARLKDAYIIINLLFEEMVAAGMQTKGRQMAGRLLYSAGYAETVKYLENQIL